MATKARLLRTVLYKLGTSGVSFFIGVLTAHFLTVSARGVYNSVGITLLLGSTFFEGYASFFNYGLNRIKLDRQKVVSNVSRHIKPIFIGNLILLAITIPFALTNPQWLQVAFFLGTFPFIIAFSYCSRLLQALNEIDLLNRLNLIQPFTFMTLCLILFIEYKRDTHNSLTFTLFMYLASYLIAAVFAVFATQRKAKVTFCPKWDKNINSIMVPFGNRIGAQNVLTQLNYRGDFYMVEWLAGWKPTGWYGNAVALSELLWQISQSMSLIVYSGIAKEERSRSISLTERTFRYSFWILITGGVAMFLCAPLIPILYGHKFAPSIKPFKILLIGTIAYGATGVLTQFFTDQLGKVKYPLYMQGFCVVTNILTCWFLIPRIGMIGGAIASSAAYSVALIVSIIYYKIQTKRPLHHLFIFNTEDVAFVRGVRQRRIHHNLSR